MRLGHDPVEDTGDASWTMAGPIGEIQVPIPGGASGELLFDIHDTPPVQPPCPAVAYLIDELRAEGGVDTLRGTPGARAG